MWAPLRSYFFLFCGFRGRCSAERVKITFGTADIFLIMFASVPLGFASPVMRAFFTADQCFKRFFRHVSFASFC